MNAKQAADLVRRVDGELHDAIHPYPDIRTLEGLHEDDHEIIFGVRQHLLKAEDMLDTGVGGGEPQVSDAMRELREAYNELERLPVSRIRPFDELVVARAEGLRTLGTLVGIG